MTTKALQMFSNEYLEYAKQLTPRQIVDFLEDFRQIAAAGQPQKSKLISMKVPQNLLDAFKIQAKLAGRPYQSLIKDLMRTHVMQGAKELAN
ncbi:MAG: CopG family antitoxin [Myxococcaceae bacterium]